MLDAGVEPVGVSPVPPDFVLIAQAYGLATQRLQDVSSLGGALKKARSTGKPCLIELTVE
jgi:acetolactate synthase-1/2/3 large subunit